MGEVELREIVLRIITSLNEKANFEKVSFGYDVRSALTEIGHLDWLGFLPYGRKDKIVEMRS